MKAKDEIYWVGRAKAVVESCRTLSQYWSALAYLRLIGKHTGIYCVTSTSYDYLPSADTSFRAWVSYYTIHEKMVSCP